MTSVHIDRSTQKFVAVRGLRFKYLRPRIENHFDAVKLNDL